MKTFAVIACLSLALAAGFAASGTITPSNPAQDAITAAMIDACKGAAQVRFNQAQVGDPIDVDGFRALVVKLRDCRDKLFIATTDNKKPK